MLLIHNALRTQPAPALPEVPIAVDRRTLAKRLWRATEADGTEFGFELDAPLTHGACVHSTATACYVVRQAAEPVIAIQLPSDPASAAITGWAVGNLHFPIEAQAHRLLAPDDSALRQSLERMGIAFESAVEVFQPHRLAAGAAPHGHPPAKAAHPFVFKPLASE